MLLFLPANRRSIIWCSTFSLPRYWRGCEALPLGGVVDAELDAGDNEEAEEAEADEGAVEGMDNVKPTG